MQIRQKVLAALAVSLVMSAFAPAASAVTPRSLLEPDDWDAPVVADTRGVDTTVDTTQGLFDDDPTGLVPKTPFVQRYSMDQDHWEVWLCGSVTHPCPRRLPR